MNNEIDEDDISVRGWKVKKRVYETGGQEISQNNGSANSPLSQKKLVITL